VEIIAAVLFIAGYLKKDLVLCGALIGVAIGIGGVLKHVRINDPMNDAMPIIMNRGDFITLCNVRSNLIMINTEFGVY